MLVDKAMRKETVWTVNLGQGKKLLLKAIEDTSAGEPDVELVMQDTEKKVLISASVGSENFQNLSGLFNSFAQVCLGVEPDLPEDEGYAEPARSEPEPEVKEPEVKVPELEEPELKVPDIDEPRVIQASPLPPSALDDDIDPPVPVTPQPGREPARLMNVAFPPKFPVPDVDDDDDEDDPVEPPTREAPPSKPKVEEDPTPEWDPW